jgi:hypothetical protein
MMKINSLQRHSDSCGTRTEVLHGRPDRCRAWRITTNQRNSIGLGICSGRCAHGIIQQSYHWRWHRIRIHAIESARTRAGSGWKCLQPLLGVVIR